MFSPRLLSIAALFVFAATVPLLHAEGPAWWSSRDVIDAEAEHADYAPLLLGQLKWMATNAFDEVSANLPGGAGGSLTSFVQGLTNANSYSPVNVGQLKQVASLFYDRLEDEGYTNAYPWASSTNAAADQAVASIGQLKFLFDFTVASFDADSDGMADWWEVAHLGGTNASPTADSDSDGMSNLSEYSRHTNPTNDASIHATLTVDPVNGYDVDNGVCAPKKTITAAIAAALDGDTVQAEAGAYDELPTTFDLSSKDVRLVLTGDALIH